MLEPCRAPQSTRFAYLDPDAIAALCDQRRADQPPIFCRLVGLYLIRAATDLEGAKEALARSEPLAAGKFAHSLKGSSAQIGATAFAERAAEAEEAAKMANVDQLSAALSDLEESLPHLAEALERVRARVTTAGAAGDTSL